MADGSKSSSRIMIVEDNPGVTRALSSLLRHEGYDAVVFHAAEPALDYIRGQTPPDAALIDIHLPGLSGLELTHRLREVLGDTVPIIIISGDTSMDTLRSLPNAGATYFFSKPVNAKQLMGQLKEWVA